MINNSYLIFGMIPFNLYEVGRLDWQLFLQYRKPYGLFFFHIPGCFFVCFWIGPNIFDIIIYLFYRKQETYIWRNLVIGSGGLIGKSLCLFLRGESEKVKYFSIRRRR
jgi:hypothetical protein